MEVRGEEYYNLNHANTERFKVSSIPFMQMILNAKIKLTENQSRKRKYSRTGEMRKKRKPG